MAQIGFYFNAKRCTGCHGCVLACKDYNNLSEGEAFRNVFEYGGGSWTDNGDGTWVTDSWFYHVSCACNHCDNPGCIAATGNDGTIVKDPETGLVLIVDAAAIADPASVAAACPYGAPVVDEATGLLKKCDGCYSRIMEGKQPICVEACPVRAIECGDIEELRAKYGDVCAIAPMADPTLTMPNLVITEPEHVQPAGSDTGMVENVREIA